MEAAEVRTLTLLEGRHWWYAERRALLRRELRALPGPPGRVALDVGAAGGGNTRVLRSAGWRAVALEHGEEGSLVARERGLATVRGDAEALPVRTAAVDLVVAFDVLEHLVDDAAAARELRRVLRPGGTALVAVPADLALWSAHDEAVGHVRRYDRRGLVDVLTGGGLVVEDLRSWNVLLRPVARWRRRSSTGSDLSALPPPVNAGLRAVVALERWVPVGGLPGVSLVARARRPG